MTEYEPYWTGAHRKQMETATVTLEDGKPVRVQRVMACQDALLPPRATNTDWRDRESTQTEFVRRPGRLGGQPPMSGRQQQEILALYRSGLGGPTIAKHLGLSKNTVQSFLYKQKAARRVKATAA